MTELKEPILTEIKSKTKPTVEEDGNTQNVQADVWTSRSRISKSVAREYDVERNNVREVIKQLDENGDVILWFGLLTVAEKDYLNAIIQNEMNSKFPRTILIGQCNQLKS